MVKLKRTTVIFESSLHQALRAKALETNQTVSELVNAAVRATFADDADDLAVVRARAKERRLRFEDVLKHLKRRKP
jgi:2-oxo-4-hydroxy-4-carboxy--5-ureidoimidazoline (OHCU) decarboxylase